MSSSNKSNLNSAAKDALYNFKMEAAKEVGVNLKQGYNGDLTSRQAGSVGGQQPWLCDQHFCSHQHKPEQRPAVLSQRQPTGCPYSKAARQREISRRAALCCFHSTFCIKEYPKPPKAASITKASSFSSQPPVGRSSQ